MISRCLISCLEQEQIYLTASSFIDWVSMSMRLYTAVPFIFTDGCQLCSCKYCLFFRELSAYFQLGFSSSFIISYMKFYCINLGLYRCLFAQKYYFISFSPFISKNSKKSYICCFRHCFLYTSNQQQPIPLKHCYSSIYPLSKSSLGFAKMRKECCFGMHFIANKNIVIMNPDRDEMVNYQITVTNVISIGNKSMANFYVSFINETGSQQWKSPLVYGKVTKENTRYPWSFQSNSAKMMVNYYEVDDKHGTDKLTGSTPLILFKREGEEEFLVFGCTESNSGRKVVEIDFSYSQTSMAPSAKKSSTSNEDGRRYNLQNTIQAQNYDIKKSLNVIPEQSYTDNRKQSSMINTRLNIPNDILFDQSHLDSNKLQSNRNRNFTEDSNFQLNLIKEMEDATDRWYRKNFGISKPSNLQNMDFEYQNSRIVSVLYEKDYEFLNDITFTSPHLQLRNMVIQSEKKPRSIQFYSIDMDGSQLYKDKIATMQVGDGYKYEWMSSVRLPKEKKAFGIEIITTDKQKLQGLLIKQGNKQTIEIFNRAGKKSGKINYSLKEVKKIEIQTCQMMQLEPISEQPYELPNVLDKSFRKQGPKSVSTPPISFIAKYEEEQAAKERNLLVKQIYLNREKQQQSFHQQTLKQKLKSKINKFSEEFKEVKEQKQKMMQNNVYIGRGVSNSPKKNFRKNQYEVDYQPADPIRSKKDTIKLSSFSQRQSSKKPTNIHSSISEKTPTNSSNQFLSSKFHQLQLQRSQEPSYEEQVDKHDDEEDLQRKIENVKQIGIDLKKKTKNQIFQKFSKNTKYKTIVYDDPNQRFNPAEIKKSPSNSDSQERQKHKKSYRQPINVSTLTPSFQSFGQNNEVQSSQKQKTKSIKSKRDSEKIVIPQTRKDENEKKWNIILSTLKAKQIRKSDDEEQIPITRHKTNDQNTIMQIIKRKEAEQKQQQKSLPQRSQTQQKKPKSLGVNTQRMTIVNNILQNSYVPTTPTQKRQTPMLQEHKSQEHQWSQGWQGRQMGSYKNTIIENQNKTKYSSRTIQPATQLSALGKLNYLITTISVDYYESCFGNKFVKVYIPNKHYYQTTLSNKGNNFLWKCNGFLFSHVHQNQDMFVQFYNSVGEEQKMLGRVILNCREFQTHSQGAVVRAYLILQSKIVGQIVLGFEDLSRNKKKIHLNQMEERKRQRASLSQHHIDLHKQHKTTPKKKKNNKRNKTLNDSLTDFLKKNKKDKINRYMVNEFSRAHIQSRIKPTMPSKYSNGKNIIIGRDIRFPFSIEQQDKKQVPGPGAYQYASQFLRYRSRQRSP